MTGYTLGAAAGAVAYVVWRARRSEFFREPDFDVTAPAGVCLLEETHASKILVSGKSRSCNGSAGGS